MAQKIIKLRINSLIPITRNTVLVHWIFSSEYFIPVITNSFGKSNVHTVKKLTSKYEENSIIYLFLHRQNVAETVFSAI